MNVLQHYFLVVHCRSRSGSTTRMVLYTWASSTLAVLSVCTFVTRLSLFSLVSCDVTIFSTYTLFCVIVEIPKQMTNTRHYTCVLYQACMCGHGYNDTTIQPTMLSDCQSSSGNHKMLNFILRKVSSFMKVRDWTQQMPLVSRHRFGKRTIFNLGQ